MTLERWVQLKRVLKLCNNDTAKKRTEQGYDPCYKYSKKASEEFFAYPVEAFLFVKYVLSDKGLEFIKDKHE